MPVNSRALVKPAVAKARVHARHDAVLRPDSEKIRDVEAEGRVAVVVAADEAAVHEEQHIAKGPVELKIDTPARIARRNLELLAVPAHAGLRIAPSQRLVSMRLQRLIADKWQLHRPVVRQVERPPLGVVVTHLGKLEIAGLGKVILAFAESEIAGGVSAMPKHKLPSKIKKKLLARSDGDPCGRRGTLRGVLPGGLRAGGSRHRGKQGGRARPRGARHQAGGGKRQSRTKQIATGDAGHGKPLSS